MTGEKEKPKIIGNITIPTHKRFRKIVVDFKNSDDTLNFLCNLYELSQQELKTQIKDEPLINNSNLKTQKEDMNIY